MKVAILDGYVDEPSCLGVPPYISPYPRYIAGAIVSAGHEYSYLTIDDVRKGAIPKGDVLVIISGALVPGKYLRGMPASIKELKAITREFESLTILGGPIVRFGLIDTEEDFDFCAKKDLDASIFDFLINNEFSNRNRTLKEWNKWAIVGVEIVKGHPDFPQPLIAELDSYRGCVRYLGGGCSFCIEPLYGKPIFREPEDIIQEVEELSKIGVVNFRLGGQSCMYSYKAKGINTNKPRPNVDEIQKLLRGIRLSAQNLIVFHTDNADPAMIADYPDEAREITRLITEYCTSGNVLAFGLESADPKVIEENNLNSTPEQVIQAVKIVNEFGKQRGGNGMPKLLPGINFISGLPGESSRTNQINYEFLKGLLKTNLLVRRINIRQVSPTRLKKPEKKFYKEFRRFKELVRKTIDHEMLKRIVPKGTVMKDVYSELHEGKTTFGRQVGSYPLLVGLPYKAPLNRFMDVMITSHGYRSVTGFEFPLDVNNASVDAISSLPNVGRKRALRIFKARPFKQKGEFINAIDDPELANELINLVHL